MPGTPDSRSAFASLTPAKRLNFNDVKKGDVIEAFVTERIAAEIGVA